MSFLQIPIGTYPNTFLGYQSSISMTTGNGNTAFGYQTLISNTTGGQNVAVGNNALGQNISGDTSVAVGFNALFNQTTGFENVAIGHASAGGLTTGQGNIAIGAGASVGNLGSSGNITIGRSAGYVTTVNECVLIGNDSGNVNQGSNNTFIGTNSGGQITTGAKNTIVGSFRGNQFGLDIRTLSNYIVLSDGDGNPRLWIDNTGAVNIPGGFVLPGGTANGVLYLNGSKVVTSGSALTFDGANLGLGTASRVNSGNYSTLTINGSTGGQIAFKSGDVAKQYIYTTATDITYRNDNGAQIWYGTGGEQMRLISTGLGIGTSSWPTAQRLRVAGGDVGFEGQFLYLVNANANIQLGASQNSRIINTDSTNTLDIGRTGASSIITFSTAGSERARIPAAGGMVVGTAALATTATDGFLYVPTCAGTPTGTPTTQTGTAPIVVDTTNNKLYFYSGGQWRDAGP